MSNNDWYSTQSWYEPLHRVEPAPAAAQAAPKVKNRKKRVLRIVGGTVLLALLLVGSSLVFREKETPQIIKPGVQENLPTIDPFQGNDGTGDSVDDMPDNAHDFFDNFYQSTTTDVADINIPQAELPVDMKLELKPASGKELSLQQLYESCSKSIVAISGYTDGKLSYSWGTGVILSSDGLILTNTHVIDGSDTATVVLYDDRSYEAKLVGGDSVSDIALLKIDAEDLPAAELGESSAMQVGDKVAAIGNPLGEEFRMTMTDGIISAIERGISYNGHNMTLLQTNTALNEGNSGGALFNMYGQVVGVTNMKMMSSYSSIEGIGFAIPTSTVRVVGNSLLQYGEMRGRPSVGITVGAIPEAAAEEYGLPGGLYVTDVSKGSDAEIKGMQPGDVVTHVNGIAVSSTEEVAAIKNEMAVGDIMEITVWREGETIVFEIELMDTNDVYGK